MKKFRPVALILILCVLFSLLLPAAMGVPAESGKGQDGENQQTATPEATPAPREKNADGIEIPDIAAHNVIITDLDTGKVIYSKNADEKAYPASLTKIMTVLLAVEAVEKGTVALSDKIEAYADCRSDLDEDSSTANIVPGEILTFEELMYCALVESANEACNIIAERLGDGSISTFVDMMNAKAEALGCKGTHFVNPHGLPNDNHYTTANDMFAISKEAMTHDLFATICNTQSYTVPATNKSEERVIYNSNALISGKGVYGSGYIYDYAAGIKTGHTAAAGYCLISTAAKDDIHLMCVVMGCGTTVREDGSTRFGNFADTINLYKWVFDNYQFYTVFSADALVHEAKILYAPEGEDTVNLHPEHDISVLIPRLKDDAGNAIEPKFENKVTLYEETPQAPVKAGDALGEMEIFLNGTSLGKTKLLAATDVEKSQAAYVKEHLHNTFGQLWVKIVFCLLILVVLIYAGLVVRYRLLRQKHLKEKRRAEQERQRRQEEEAASKIFASQPRMEYFTPDEMNTRPHLVRPDTPVQKATGDPKQKDYFDEFFRRENDSSSKKRKK